VNLFSCNPINVSVVDVLAKLREMIVCRKPHSIIRNIFILANSLQYEVNPGLMSRLTILDITNENRSKSQLLRS
jgi:hypothetical protein